MYLRGRQCNMIPRSPIIYNYLQCTIDDNFACEEGRICNCEYMWSIMTSSLKHGTQTCKKYITYTKAQILLFLLSVIKDPRNLQISHHCEEVPVTCLTAYNVSWVIDNESWMTISISCLPGYLVKFFTYLLWKFTYLR